MRIRLKIWAADLEQVRMGRKRAEVRRCDDRKFVVGQELELEGFDPETNTPIPELCVEVVRITHVETMAGPHRIVGITREDAALVPLVVLSFDLVS